MTSAGLAEASATLLSEPHHDGSDTYVLERPLELGGEATVQLRVSHAGSVDKVALRYVHDGEPVFVQAERAGDALWRATFPVPHPATRYRWLLAGGELGYAWLNGTGLVRHDIPDADDFVMTTGDTGPEWHLDSVVYEIFPDRFASSGLDVDAPAWAMPRAWDELPRNRGIEQAYELFGGDLYGIEQRLDHIASLGANVIYLTPFFPAGSTHRYDATSFDRVDPLLGGDEALVSLVGAAHARGIRVIGDLTVNHVGVTHEWFDAEPEFFYRDDSDLGYEAWLGVPSLPKLNHASPRLAGALRDVVQKWLRPPFELDGWRIDVANMAGRLGETDLAHDVARAVRAAAVAAKPDAILIAEHGHDFREDLAVQGWHGAMNYSGFLRPVWWWLRDASFARDPFRADFPAPIFDGDDSVATMRAFRAGIPWHATLHSWTLLDSHDSPRFSRVTRTRERHVVGVGLQMTTPGVPMVFAGDELGLGGDWGEDARRPMPWDAPESWDHHLLEEYRALIALRRTEPALARGGIRYVHVSAEAIAYVRETPDDALLCLACRGAHEPIRVPFGPLETLFGDDAPDGVLPAHGPSFHVWRIPNG